ncbi:hypothetical protein Q8F55_005611 [Vanrija albida]|uniref:Major facilitator superfamily (MFS) profile domain-containing protein n=1 Tax=Vanrija albida TaxID=181172 RepID=A0ABR3Q2P0_9TREE
MAVEAQDYTQLSRGQLIFSFSLVTSFFFLWGLSYGLLDVLNQHFLHNFNLTKTQSTLLQFSYFIAYLVVSPPMGWVMRRLGYKKGIHIGLGLFSIGAILFWPSAKFGKYGMFVAFTFLAGSGIATLEVAANTYITVLGPPKHAGFRLTLAQAFNGIATVVGPQIGAHAFFNESNKDSLGSVQYVYLALAVFALLLNIGVYFAKLPEVRQHVTPEEEQIMEEQGWRGFLRQRHTLFGFAAEWFYVGAQVAVATMTVFYVIEQGGYDAAMGANLLSACQAVFTVGRFIGVAYLRYVDPAFSLAVNGVGLVIFSILTSVLHGKAGIGCLFIIFLFESTCYPVIYSIAVSNLGGYTKIGGGLLCAGVSGGAAYPAMQAALADVTSTRLSFLIPMTGFVPLMLYGMGMWAHKCNRRGVWSMWVKDLDGAEEAEKDAHEAAIRDLDAKDTKDTKDTKDKTVVQHVEAP